LPGMKTRHLQAIGFMTKAVPSCDERKGGGIEMQKGASEGRAPFVGVSFPPEGFLPGVNPLAVAKAIPGWSGSFRRLIGTALQSRVCKSLSNSGTGIG